MERSEGMRNENKRVLFMERVQRVSGAFSFGDGFLHEKADDLTAGIPGDFFADDNEIRIILGKPERSFDRVMVGYGYFLQSFFSGGRIHFLRRGGNSP